MVVFLKQISLRFFSLLLSIFLLNGCTAVGYYTQSIVGHTSLMLSRKPIDDVLITADAPLKKKLSTAVKIRQFAIDQLALPDNDSYTSYVKLKNNSPVWNVVAAEEFSLQAKQWCYLVIGCANYRGYYKRESAEEYAKELRTEGYEVLVSGAAAYSTLGWFADPLTSAMIARNDVYLAELMFHELSHQKVYVKNDSRFNEAFASAVGEQGAIVWLKATQQQGLLDHYLESLSVRDDFLTLVNQAKTELSILYASDVSEEIKRHKKKLIFEKMKAGYLTFKKEKWSNKGWYSYWFSKPINNARLVSIATYRDLVPDFVALFERCDSDFSRFYQKVEQVSTTPERSLAVECDV